MEEVEQKEELAQHDEGETALVCTAVVVTPCDVAMSRGGGFLPPALQRGRTSCG